MIKQPRFLIGPFRRKKILLNVPTPYSDVTVGYLWRFIQEKVDIMDLAEVYGQPI